MLLTNNPDVVFNVTVSDNLLGTDHSAIWFSILYRTSPNIVQKKLLYNYAKADFDHFLCLLSWDTIDFDSDIDISWNWTFSFSAVDDAQNHSGKIPNVTVFFIRNCKFNPQEMQTSSGYEA